MDSQVTNYQCPACNAPLHFAGATGKLQCDYCDSSFEVAEIEAMLKEQNEKAAAAMEATAQSQWDMTGMSEDWGSEAQGMKTYSCPSCAAELICDENTAATCCPYCGNQTVIPGQFSGSLKPEYVVPFKTDKNAAVTALKNYYKGKKFLPKSFAEGNHVEDVQGVYVPFWMFDCEAFGDMEFSASTSTTKKSGNKETTTTKYYRVYRSGNLKFEKVPVDASSRMPDEHMDSIEPYDYSQLKEFSMAYMPGFLADKYDVTAQECGGRMQERCAKTFEDEVAKTVTGYDNKHVRSRAVSVKKGAVHYAMMPVWLLATKWNDQDFLFAMNGQTGKLVGDLPVDKGKYWGYFGGISAFLLAVMLLLNFCFFTTPLTGVTMVLGCFVMPFLVAFGICSAWKGQMKTVRPQRAAAYITKSGLTLSRKEDVYERTATKTKEVSGT